MDEVFVPIAGFPEYLVSNFGRIKSQGRYVPGKVGKRIHKERILKVALGGKNRNYEFVKLSNGSGYVSKRVAVLVAEAFLGERPCGFDVDHIDKNTRNNCVENLRYLLIRENRGGRRNG